jgi:hypothetical protein
MQAIAVAEIDDMADLTRTSAPKREFRRGEASGR